MIGSSKNERTLKDHLINEIKRSGYPLEIFISSILEDNDWVVLNNQPFRDSDEDKLRSVDILAFHNPTTYEYKKYEPLGFSPNLIIECKKSENHAWIFFSRPEKSKVFRMSGHVHDYPKLFSTKAYSNRDKLSNLGHFSYEYYFNYFNDPNRGMRNVHYSDFDSVAITYDEYKIKKGTRNTRKNILEAVNQTVKFFLFDLEESINSPGRINGAVSSYYPIIVTFLAIVLDGKLFDARIENNNVTLEERKHILYNYTFRPRNSYVNIDFWIDIVKKEFFSSYLSKIKKDISLISDKIIFERELLLSYLKKDSVVTAHETV